MMHNQHDAEVDVGEILLQSAKDTDSQHPEVEHSVHIAKIVPSHLTARSPELFQTKEVPWYVAKRCRNDDGYLALSITPSHIAIARTALTTRSVLPALQPSLRLETKVNCVQLKAFTFATPHGSVNFGN
jgi:hypothetical protein